MTTETKHTQGPWRVARTNNGTMIAGGTPGYIAEVRPCHDDRENVANADLIAAAPDLLAALREITTVVAPKNSHAEVMANIARAALAKAEGKA